MDLEILKEIWSMELYHSGDKVIRLSQVCIAVLITIIGLYVSRIVSLIVGRKLARIDSFKKDTAYVIQRISYYLMLLLIIFIALPVAGVPITIFTILGSAVAIGVGFGAKNLFNNLISGIIILIEKPVRLHDIIKVKGEEGVVEEIGNRCVRVRRIDGIDVLVPNSYFLEQPVVNWTLSDGHVKSYVAVGVKYGSPAEKVKELLLKVAANNDQVKESPKPLVIFDDFGDSALIFKLYFWSAVSSPFDLSKISSELRFEIDGIFRKENITIAFTQADIHLNTLEPLEIQLKQ